MKTLAYLAWFAGATALAFAQENKKASSTSAADQAAVRAVDQGHEAFLAAMRGNDANALARLLATDAVFYPPNGSPLVGPDAVRRWFQGIVEKMRTTGVSVTDRHVTVSGDRAIEEGQFVWTVAPVGGGAAIEDRGRFLAIWQRQPDGSWKGTRDIWNSMLPLPSSQGTAAMSANRTDDWFTLRFTTIKPDMVNEFERLQKEELIPALKKGGVTMRAATTTAMFGDGYVYVFGSPLTKFAELDEVEPLVKALGEAGANALLQKLRACHVTTRVLALRNIADLSWEHSEPMKMFVVTRHELAPGRKTEWMQYMRDHFVPAVRKNSAKQYFVQETVYGGGADEVYTLRWFDRYADLDEGGLRRRMGDAAYSNLTQKLPPGVVVRSERFVIRTRPELSILPAPKPKTSE